jgi:hypothetical protein
MSRGYTASAAFPPSFKTSIPILEQMALSEAIAPNLSRWVGRAGVAKALPKSPRLRRALQTNILRTVILLYKKENAGGKGKKKVRKERITRARKLVFGVQIRACLPALTICHSQMLR